MSQHDYAEDRQWEGSFVEQVIRILTPLTPYITVLSIASEEQDIHQATDFELQLQGGAVACRLRRPYYQQRDLTIRSWRKGRKTELAKIQEGLAPSWYFYGWTSENNMIEEWILVDMNKVIEKGLLNNRQEKRNGDKTTGFIWIPSWELIRKGCLIAYRLHDPHNTLYWDISMTSPVAAFYHEQKMKHLHRRDEPPMTTLFELTTIQPQSLF